jgi:H+/Cl- antiporter ClcA
VHRRRDRGNAHRGMRWFPHVASRIRPWSGLRVPLFSSASAPLDVRIVGRTLLHAALVGLAAGLTGAAFFGGLEYVQRLLLEELAGYSVLRAHGERFAAPEHLLVFRPWVLLLLPALGGLGCGLLTRLAPETRGGGGDAMIQAFHVSAGIVRKRVIWIKMLASACTLGTGGAGGREGPSGADGGHRCGGRAAQHFRYERRAGALRISCRPVSSFRSTTTCGLLPSG